MAANSKKNKKRAARADAKRAPRNRLGTALRETQARLKRVFEVSSDWYWEQDEHYRFTVMAGKALEKAGIDRKRFLGTTRWEQEEMTVADGGNWDEHKAALAARQPYTNFIVQHTGRKGRRRYFSNNGQPMFDARGRFRGYCGISKEVTREKRAERLLQLENAVIRCLEDAPSIDVALETTLRAICEAESWEAGQYWRLDERVGVMRFAGGWSVSHAAIKRIVEQARDVVFKPGIGLVGWVWQSGQPLWVPDTEKDARVLHKALSRASRWHGAFLVPVATTGKTIGVLAFSSHVIREPDDRLLQTASVIGKQVGQFLQRKQAEDVLRDSEARFRALTNLSSDWYWEQDTEFRFTRVESRRDDVALARAHLLNKLPWEAGIQIEGANGWVEHQKDLAAHKSYRDLVMFHGLEDGSLRYLSVNGEPIFDGEGRFAGYRGISREVTAQKRAEEQIQYLATHDSLTDLPNRFMFNQLLNLAIATAQRYKRTFAVMFIDLDRFKNINDTLGHEAGDVLLKEISVRLKQCLRSSDVVARLGGDEFVVLIQEVTESKYVSAVARKILSAILKPMVLVGQECRVTGSIGISMFPNDAQNEETLMKNADMAMYLAKEEGKNNFQFYSEDIKSQSLEKMALETSLRQALEREELALHYQAKLDLKHNTITGVEALLRWQHPDLGNITPAQFIPIAEETGLIVPIGRWVLQTACAQNMAWQRAGLPPVCMAVNLSPRQFADENLLKDIAAVLAETGMPPKLLEIELTESMVMHNTERAVKLLTAISAMGVRLAIDDFGTGYSSLAQIKRFPIDTLKVDRSFIRDLMQNPEDRAITQAIIAMGKTLSLTVVAEGVETAEQETFLREHACDESQGYHFSRPTTPDKFAELLRAHVAQQK